MPGTRPTTASALPARPVRTQKGESQAQRIVAAAYRCLADYGYAETPMQRIADEAGTTKRMLLYYFQSRGRSACGGGRFRTPHRPLGFITIRAAP